MNWVNIWGNTWVNVIGDQWHWPFVIQLLIKVTLLLLIMLSVTRMLRGRSAALRHSVMSTTLAAVPLLILVHFFAPSWSVSLPDHPYLDWIALRQVENDISVDETSVDAVWKATNTAINEPKPEANGWQKKAVDDSHNGLSLARPAAKRKPNFSATTQDTESVGLCASQEAALVVPSMESTQWHSTVLAKLSQLGISGILVLAWTVGCGLLLMRLILAWSILLWRIKKSKPISTTSLARELVNEINQRGIEVRVSENREQMPLCLSFVSKTILLPGDSENWSRSQIESVLFHELAHDQRGDCLINLVARGQQAVFWFHPLFWSLIHQLRSDSEIACDDLVLSRGVDRLDYANSLLHIATQLKRSRAALVASVSMADCSPLEHRMKFILSGSTPRQPVSKPAWLTTVAAVLIGTTSIATAGYLGTGTAPRNETTAIETTSNQIVGTDSAPAKPEEATASGLEVVAPATDLQFIVTLKENGNSSTGTELIGKVEEKFNVDTKFGSATLMSDQIRLLIATDPGNYRIETNDDSAIFGSIDQKSFELVTSKNRQRVLFSNVTKMVSVGNARLVPEQSTNGFAANGISYHIRAPQGYQADRAYPALVLLHGPDSNAEQYIKSVVNQWPAIAAKYILIGINGEFESKTSTAEQRRFNYTYVDFVGRSKYKGFPGTDRQSPALVAEVITQLRQRIPISHLYVGGHSDGGFLAISLYMNYPELMDGAFPVAGGMLVQCTPDSYEDEALRRSQRTKPLAIIHSPVDQESSPQYSNTAFQAYIEGGFSLVRYLNDSQAGHDFEKLPIEQAVAWLEKMNQENLARSLDFAEQLLSESAFRECRGLLQKIRNQPTRLNSDPESTKRLRELEKQLAQIARDNSLELSTAIRDQQDGSWIDSYLQYEQEFQLFPEAKATIAAFSQLKEKHEANVQQIYLRAKESFADGLDLRGYKACQKIVENYYASEQAAWARKKLDSRKLTSDTQTKQTD